MDLHVIINFIRSELDHKINHLANAQPDVSALVQDLFMLERDTNATLEAHSARLRGFQEELSTDATFPSKEWRKPWIKSTNSQEGILDKFVLPQ